MLEQNLIKIYEQSFRDNREMAAITDYFKGETFSYYEMAKEIAKLHLMFKEAGVEKGDKIALIGRNNTRWCISYIATITYGAIYRAYPSGLQPQRCNQHYQPFGE